MPPLTLPGRRTETGGQGWQHDAERLSGTTKQTPGTGNACRASGFSGQRPSWKIPFPTLRFRRNLPRGPITNITAGKLTTKTAETEVGCSQWSECAPLPRTWQGTGSLLDFLQRIPLAHWPHIVCSPVPTLPYVRPGWDRAYRHSTKDLMYQLRWLLTLPHPPDTPPRLMTGKGVLDRLASGCE